MADREDPRHDHPWRTGRSRWPAACSPPAARPSRPPVSAGDWEARRTRMIDSQLRARGIATNACSRPCTRCPGTCSCRKSTARARTTTARCRLGTTRRFRSPTSWVHERGPRAATDGSSARNRDGVGLSGGDPRLSSRRDVYTIEIVPELAERARAALEARGVSQRARPPRQRLSRLARGRTVRPHHRHRGARRRSPRRWSINSRSAASWSSPSACLDDQVMTIVRKTERASSHAKRCPSASCR